MTIHFPTSFLTSNALEVVCKARLALSSHVFVYLLMFSFVLQTRLGLPHDAIWDAFASIIRGVGFHVSWEQTHILPPPFLQSSLRWVNIVLSIDGIHTLVNVVITDPTQAYLVSRATLLHGVAMRLIAHVKEGFYHDCYLTNVFLPSAIEVFGCLHQQANKFLHQCANMVWTTKGTKGPSLSMLQCCVPFINKECLWHYKESRLFPSRNELLLQGKVHLGLEFYQVYLLLLYSICFTPLMEG